MFTSPWSLRTACTRRTLVLRRTDRRIEGPRWEQTGEWPEADVESSSARQTTPILHHSAYCAPQIAA